MIINSSNVDMRSTRIFSSVASYSKATVTTGRKIAGFRSLNGFSNTLKLNVTKAENTQESSRTDSAQELRNKTITWLIDLLTRMKNRTVSSDENGADTLNITTSSTPTMWTETTEHFSYSEAEETTFAATGAVVTGDGRTIPVDVSFSLSRSFTQSVEYTSISNVSSILTDPLILNLDSSPATVSSQKFLFDLDSDGDLEEISAPSKGNAFLALDKNGDGTINDGSELFGTLTGNGFKELAAYDLDNNGYIDENDEIFKKLKVWIKDEEGNDVLLNLKEANVGAICLKNIDAAFSMTDENNALNGLMRRTGFYIKETGECASISQIDLSM